MTAFNSCVFAGNLTRDVDLRAVGETSVASFSVAINRKYKTKSGEQREDVTFIDCEAWGRTGELAAQYLHKGSSCLVQGSMKTSTWDDAATGAKRKALKLNVDTLQFIGGSKEDGAGTAQATRDPGRQTPKSSAPGADEPPF